LTVVDVLGSAKFEIYVIDIVAATIRKKSVHLGYLSTNKEDINYYIIFY